MSTPTHPVANGAEFDEFVRDMEEQIESTRRSEMLTADDYAVRINASADDFGRGPDIVKRQSHER